jgi:hypothetical protein
MTAFTREPFGIVAPLLYQYGYSPVPIPPGRKGPLVNEWQVPRKPGHYLPYVDPETGRRTHCGLYGTGILTRYCPAIDIDIRDRELVRVLIELADEMLGVAPFRVGARPKTLLLYGGGGFGRITGRWWALPGDDFTNEGYAGHRVEILCDGQQAVAFAKHPRGTYYRWRRYSPISLSRSVLVPINETEARDYLAAAERIIKKVGAIPIKKERGVWIEDKPKTQMPRRYDFSDRRWEPSAWQQMDPETLAKAIGARSAKRTRQGWITACPAHKSEGGRSLTVNPRDGGGSLVKCWAECSYRDIARAIESIVGRAA